MKKLLPVMLSMGLTACTSTDLRTIKTEIDEDGSKKETYHKEERFSALVLGSNEKTTLNEDVYETEKDTSLLLLGLGLFGKESKSFNRKSKELTSTKTSSLLMGALRSVKKSNNDQGVIYSKFSALYGFIGLEKDYIAGEDTHTLFWIDFD